MTTQRSPVSYRPRPDRTATVGTTVREAMAVITATHQGLLPVIESDGRLIGVVTDGDIRRGLLAGMGLDQKLDSIVNRVPIVVSADKEEHEIAELMRATNKICIPVVDEQGRYIRLAYFDRQIIPNCVPCLEGREQAFVSESISNGWLATGPFIERFERAIAAYTGAPHAVALANGTAALHLALLAVGVRHGDLVLLPTTTFAASANAIKYCGADPVFFDVEPDSWGIDVSQLRRYLEQCATAQGRLVDRHSGRRIAAMMPVHVYGHPADMDPVLELRERFALPVVEDAAEALGAKYKGRPVGALSSLSALSFNGNKVITGGNGGMVLTSDAALARRVRYLANQAKDDPVEFVHGAVGYNYRMPNINAAIALAQAEQLDNFLTRKRRFVDRYASLLAEVRGIAMWREAPWATSSHWMAVLTVDERQRPDAVATLRRFLPARGIEARPTWRPLHLQPAFANAPHMEITVAERLYRSSLCLPCSAGLNDRDLEFTARTIVEFFTLHG